MSWKSSFGKHSAPSAALIRQKLQSSNPHKAARLPLIVFSWRCSLFCPPFQSHFLDSLEREQQILHTLSQTWQARVYFLPSILCIYTIQTCHEFLVFALSSLKIRDQTFSFRAYFLTSEIWLAISPGCCHKALAKRSVTALVHFRCLSVLMQILHCFDPQIASINISWCSIFCLVPSFLEHILTAPLPMSAHKLGSFRANPVKPRAREFWRTIRGSLQWNQK